MEELRRDINFILKKLGFNYRCDQCNLPTMGYYFCCDKTFCPNCIHKCEDCKKRCCDACWHKCEACEMGYCQQCLIHCKEGCLYCPSAVKCQYYDSDADEDCSTCKSCPIHEPVNEQGLCHYHA